MRFPTAKRLAEAAHFTDMRLRSVPSAVIKVKKWCDEIGAKGKLEMAWFRIKGIPMGKRSIPNIARICSLVGKAKEIDVDNRFKFEYVRAAIECRDITKVASVVEGNLGGFFYDFFLQREVPQEGTTNPAGNQWVRNDGAGGSKENSQQQKKPRLDDVKPNQGQEENKDSKGASTQHSAPPKFWQPLRRCTGNMFQSKSCKTTHVKNLSS
ncbi:hypothetical protein QOZ80_4BG0337790 [Eleusine coracana subsp. coracana]|nr:hypothetical protein QOZ80_4BG0337790 [Eleusine coracana subsp. coracana]